MEWFMNRTKAKEIEELRKQYEDEMKYSPLTQDGKNNLLQDDLTHDDLLEYTLATQGALFECVQKDMRTFHTKGIQFKFTTALNSPEWEHVRLLFPGTNKKERIDSIREFIRMNPYLETPDMDRLKQRIVVNMSFNVQIPQEVLETEKAPSLLKAIKDKYQMNNTSDNSEILE